MQRGEISKLVKGADFVAKVVVKNPGNRGCNESIILTENFFFRLGDFKYAPAGRRRSI